MPNAHPLERRGPAAAIEPVRDEVVFRLLGRRRSGQVHRDRVAARPGRGAVAQQIRPGRLAGDAAGHRAELAGELFGRAGHHGVARSELRDRLGSPVVAEQTHDHQGVRARRHGVLHRRDIYSASRVPAVGERYHVACRERATQIALAIRRLRCRALDERLQDRAVQVRRAHVRRLPPTEIGDRVADEVEVERVKVPLGGLRRAAEREHPNLHR